MHYIKNHPSLKSSGNIGTYTTQPPEEFMTKEQMRAYRLSTGITSTRYKAGGGHRTPQQIARDKEKEQRKRLLESNPASPSQHLEGIISSWQVRAKARKGARQGGEWGGVRFAVRSLR